MFIHPYEEQIGELSDESLSLLIQQLDTAYSNTTLYDDHLELNLAMERFVPDSTLRHLQHQSITSIEVELGPPLSVARSHSIRGFTTLCENLSSNESFRLVNSLLTLLGPVIEAHHGCILKFVGDGIIAMFAQKTITQKTLSNVASPSLVQLETSTKIPSKETQFLLGSAHQFSGNRITVARYISVLVGATTRVDVSVRGFSVTMASAPDPHKALWGHDVG